MSNKDLITEGLDFNDMDGQIEPLVTVDEYEAKMGKNSEIVTLSFLVSSELAADDLVDWFERGYDFVLDASVSDGEVNDGKYIVFVEMNRRSSVPSRIIELLKDLRTLTGLKLKDWTVEVEGEEHEPDENVLKQVIITNPSVYRDKKENEKENEKELNEYREIAGLNTKSITTEDEYIKNLKSIAGM